jgi:hypothetical protein
MKAITVALLLTVSIIATAQEKDNSTVSRNIIDGIKNQYPHSTLTKFKKKKDQYQATFTFEGKTHVSTFSKEGNWLKMETELLWKDLPDSVRTAYWKTAYRQMKMESIKELETLAEGKLFVIEANDLGRYEQTDSEIPSAFATEYLVYFNEKGEMVKVEKE